MRRLPLAFFIILTAASGMGLGLAWLTNVTLFGRPHEALLRVIAETAAAGMDCEAPQTSPLFQQGPIRGTLHYVLLDEHGHPLGRYGHIPTDLEAAWKAQPQSRWRADNPLHRDSIWVSIPGVCGRTWTLWAWDPENETYRHLLLPRQMILAASCSSSIILVVFLAWLFLRRKGREAEQVLTAIRLGNFGSRLKTRLGEPRLALVTEFNRMAAAVEDSIARLREMEQRRAQLFSELAHDVRTPLASLRAAAETLSEFSAQLTEVQRHNLHQTLQFDVIYFQRLIDDLLVLAQLDRSDLTVPQQTCDIQAILLATWSRMQEQFPERAQNLQWPDPEPQGLWVPGDAALVRRLLQNTLDNAFHYARSWVRVQVQTQAERLILTICNDALPLDPEALQNWGHKRRQRIITEQAGQPHTSLGLGSSIIVGVSRHLGGDARIEQFLTNPKEYAQISVIIDLPRLTAPP